MRVSGPAHPILTLILYLWCVEGLLNNLPFIYIYCIAHQTHHVNPTLFGWQTGILLRLRPVALKVGYEQSLTGYYNADIMSQSFRGDGSPYFPTTKPHSLFVRLGFVF